MRIVIGGCRDFCNYTLFCEHMDHVLAFIDDKNITILSGHCSGVDTMAEEYAKQHNLTLEIHPAQWQKFGRAAGPIRNREMVERADFVITFWDGQSKGTKSLIELAKKNRKSIKIFYIR